MLNSQIGMVDGHRHGFVAVTISVKRRVGYRRKLAIQVPWTPIGYFFRVWPVAVRVACRGFGRCFVFLAGCGEVRVLCQLRSGATWRVLNGHGGNEYGSPSGSHGVRIFKRCGDESLACSKTAHLLLQNSTQRHSS